MVIVDRILEQRERDRDPISVALVGAGYMGRGYALQFLTSVRGMRLAAIANRTVETAKRVYGEAGAREIEDVNTVGELEDAIAGGRYAVTGDASLLCQAAGIEVIIEATGEVEFGASVAVEALAHGKHVVLSNAELDATLGPILKVRADHAGVVITNIDGDEPGVAMNLVRSSASMGCRPVAAGNLKGFIDPHRTPATQQAFAAKHNQRPRMITSFADGTKLSMETTVLANATGFRVARRGMYGPRCAHVKEAASVFPHEELLRHGIVDYLLGAEPGTGAFVVGYNDHPIKSQYMSYFKMGDGPFYVFYTPYHLPQVQLPDTVARAVLFGDATVAPLGAPSCDVITVAKRDLNEGEELDGIGGFTCYGVIENASVGLVQGLLPMGLAAGCRLHRAIRADQAIRIADVEVPPGRLCDRLRAEQNAVFADELKHNAAMEMHA